MKYKFQPLNGATDLLYKVVGDMSKANFYISLKPSPRTSKISLIIMKE